MSVRFSRLSEVFRLTRSFPSYSASEKQPPGIDEAAGKVFQLTAPETV